MEEFVLRQPRVSIEEAVRRATSYPASILGLADRGTIREGAKADLLLFDPAKVHANADYVNPTARAEGFDLVMVNPAGAGGRQTGGARRAAAASRGMKDERGRSEEHTSELQSLMRTSYAVL